MAQLPRPRSCSNAKSARIGSRIAKSRSSESRTSATTANRHDRLIAQLSSSSSSHLQNMVDQIHLQEVDADGTFPASNGLKSKGKQRAQQLEEDNEDLSTLSGSDEGGVSVRSTGNHFHDASPGIDRDDAPFRIMDLPTEIRLEIYRACLTRPYNILLSKKEQPPPFTQRLCWPSDALVGDESGSDDESGSTSTQIMEDATNAQTGNPEDANALGRIAPTGQDLLDLAAQANAPASLAEFQSSAAAIEAATNGRLVMTQAGMRPWISHNEPVRPRLQMIYRNPEVVDGPERAQNQDPLLSNVLLASKGIYKEARGILYSENFFTLDITTAMHTLACLHQQSRRQIKRIELEIPTYNEILDNFQETVRLSLRYCTGLKKLVINMPFTLPVADRSTKTGSASIYANGFDILRWLPQQCEVVLRGNVCDEIEMVVNKHLHLAKTLDKLSYARRQLMSSDAGPSPPEHTGILGYLSRKLRSG